MDRSNNKLDNDNDDDSRKIIEDAPHMRSVAMAPPPRSLLGVARLPAKPYFAAQLDNPSLRKQAPSTSTTRKEGEEAEWCNKLTALEPIPTYYILERTHASVADCTPQLLAQRIADCLRQESVSATFEGNEASAETCDCVSFSVRLWSDNKNHDDNKKKIVVEVQRLSGCGFSYQQVARRILRAAKGGESAACYQQPKTFKLPSCIPKETTQEREQCIMDAVEIAETMLAKNKLDLQLLGLESLVQLSRGSCCSSPTSVEGKLFAARCILSSERSLLSTLTSLIQARFNEDEDGGALNKSQVEEEHAAILHRHALAVLANCLESLSSLNDATTIANAYSQLSSNDALLSCLVQNVALSASRPHEACLALRCLQCLCKSSTSCHNNKTCASRIQEALASSDGGGALASAEHFGLRRHSQLHEQAVAMMKLHQHF